MLVPAHGIQCDLLLKYLGYVNDWVGLISIPIISVIHHLVLQILSTVSATLQYKLWLSILLCYRTLGFIPPIRLYPLPDNFEASESHQHLPVHSS